MATHSSVLAWRIPGTVEPGGLLSMGSHRVGHDRSDLAAAAGSLNWKSWKGLLRVKSPATPSTSPATPSTPLSLRQGFLLCHLQQLLAFQLEAAARPAVTVVGNHFCQQRLLMTGISLLVAFSQVE